MIINIGIAKRTVSEELLHEGIPVLKYDISRPEPRSRAHGITRVNAFYMELFSNYLKRCRGELCDSAVRDAKDAIANGFPVREYEAIMSYTVTANENCVLSLFTDTYEYAGGAHGSTVRAAQSWFFPGGRRISLCNLFPTNTHYRAALLARINAIIAKNPEWYFEDYKKLTAEFFNPASFYIMPTGFGIFYQQYDIAPYATGIPVFEFNYDAVGATPPRCVR